jgi:hypothetical protein
MSLIIKPNPDKEKYDLMTQAVINNEGYCPCIPIKSDESKCICKDFREQNYAGECHCGRFVKVKK